MQGNRLRDELLDFGHFDFLRDPVAAIGRPERWYADGAGERRHWGGDDDPASGGFYAALLEPRRAMRRDELAGLLRTWHAAQQRAFAEGRKVAFVNAQTFWNDDSGALTRPPRSLGGNAVQWADMDLAELGLEPGAEKGALRGYE